MDIFYKRTGNSYKIHKITGFSDRIPTDYSEDFNGLKVKMKGLNLYYIFNNRRFSYPAAFSQSTNQRRSAGSFITGFSVSAHNLDFDYTQLPPIIQETMNPGMKVNHINTPISALTSAMPITGYLHATALPACHLIRQ